MVEFLRNLHARFGPIASFWYKDVYTVSLADSKYFKKTEKMFDRHKALFEFAEPLISKKSSQYLNGDFGKQRFKGNHDSVHLYSQSEQLKFRTFSREGQ